MKNSLLSLGFCAVAGLLAATPVAADDNLCGVAMHAALMDRMVGNWNTNVLSATLTSAGNPAYPLTGPKPVFPTSFSVIGGDLVISMSAQGGEVIIPLEVAQQGWTMTGSETKVGPVMTESDLTTLLDCDVNTVPRLSGKAPFSQGGISAEASVFLYVLNEDQLYGTLHIVTSEFHLREAISIGR